MTQTASWIWTRDPKGPREQYVRFRRVFTLDAQPASAKIRISADSRYRLYVNGSYLGFGPSRSYPHHQCVDVYDVSDFLRGGTNLIAVLVYQPGYSHYSYVHQGKSGLLLELETDEQKTLVSDSAWKASVDSSYSSDVQRISIYGAGQEIRDLQREEPWAEHNYDDESWETASIVADSLAVDSDASPWLETQTAPLPNLVETIMIPKRISSNCGPYVLDADPHLEMRSAYLGCSLKSTKPIEGLGAELPTVEQGKVLLQCFDLGYSQAGSARLHFSGAKGGEKVFVSYLEKEQNGRLIVSDPSTYCQMRMTDRMVLAPSENAYEPFSPRGGRFLLLGIVGPSHGELSLEVEFRARHYPLSLRKNSAPKDPALQQIAELCWRTIQSCALDGMVDCPWREQAVWVGDSAITSGIVAELCGDSRLLRRMLQLAAHGTTTDGLLPGVVVNESESTVVLAYSFAWVEGLHNYLKLTGDVEFLEQNWKVLKTMLRRFQEDLKPDGLLRTQPSRRQFLDWAELPDSDPSCLYNLRYLYALQLASTLASQTGHTRDAQKWAGWADALANAIRQAFCHQGIWYDDVNATSRSQHVAAFLVLTKLVGHEESDRLLQEAVARSLDKEGSKLVLMSPYMHFYLFLALELLHRNEDILDITRYRWGVWLDQGARTTWENWEVDFPDGSQCHAWSAHPLLFITRHADCQKHDRHMNNPSEDQLQPKKVHRS